MLMKHLKFEKSYTVESLGPVSYTDGNNIWEEAILSTLLLECHTFGILIEDYETYLSCIAVNPQKSHEFIFYVKYCLNSGIAVCINRG